MTIFTYDGNKLACDKAEYKYGVVVNDQAKKVARFTVGSVEATLVCAGSAIWASAVKEWLMQDLRNNDAIDVMDYKVRLVEQYQQVFGNETDYDALLILKRDNVHQAYYLGKLPFPHKVKTPYAGGHQDAMLVSMGAMSAGADAVEAVQIAIRLTGISPSSADVEVVEI